MIKQWWRSEIHDETHACAAYAIYFWLDGVPSSQGCTSEGYKRQKTIRTRSKTLKWQLDLPLSGSSYRSYQWMHPTDRFHRCVAVESYASLICLWWFLVNCERPCIPFNSSQRKSSMVLSLVCCPDVCQVCFNHLFDSRMWGSVATEQGQLPFGHFLSRRAIKKGIEIHKWRTGTPFLGPHTDHW